MENKSKKVKKEIEKIIDKDFIEKAEEDIEKKLKTWRDEILWSREIQDSKEIWKKYFSGNFSYQKTNFDENLENENKIFSENTDENLETENKIFSENIDENLETENKIFSENIDEKKDENIWFSNSTKNLKSKKILKILFIIFIIIILILTCFFAYKNISKNKENKENIKNIQKTEVEIQEKEEEKEEKTEKSQILKEHIILENKHFLIEVEKIDGKQIYKFENDNFENKEDLKNFLKEKIKIDLKEKMKQKIREEFL